MRPLSILCIILLYSCALFAQTNHVANNSFETYTSCPTNGSQISNCTGWFSYTTGSPDYMNSCNTGNLASVPTNTWGSQWAATGNGYATIVDFHNTNYREYVARAITPLQVGDVYEVSISVSLADRCLVGSDGLGVYFFKNGNLTTPGTGVVNKIPQVSYTNYGPVTDKLGWTRLTGYMIADSAYEYIVIGGFTDNTNINTALSSGGTENFSLYYLDDVAVYPAKRVIMTFGKNKMCAGDTIHVPFAINPLLSTIPSGNVFTLQLSDANGSFANPINIGTLAGNSAGQIQGVIPGSITIGTAYRMRIVTSNPSDTSRDNGLDLTIGMAPEKPIVTGSNSVCTIDTIFLFANTNSPGAQWNWSGPNNHSSSMQNLKISNLTTAATGSYVVSASIYGCASKDTAFVTVNQSPSITASGTTVICEQDTLKLFTTTTSGTSYAWSGPNNFSSLLQNPTLVNAQTTASGKYYITAVNVNGCSRKDSITILVKPRPFVNSGRDTVVCENNAISLTATSNLPGVSYSWTGPNSFTATTQNLVINPALPANSGSYIVTTSLNGCTATDTTQITVLDRPVFSLSSNSPVCENSNIILNLTSSPGFTFNWSGPASFISTLQNPMVSGASSVNEGRYYVTVTGSNNCPKTDSINIVVKPLPVTTASNSGPVCEGSPLSLYASTAFTGVSFQWTGPNSFTSAAQSPLLASPLASASGTYTVIATLNGCAYTANTLATVHPMPVFSLSSNSPVCENSNIVFNLTSSPGFTFNWTGPASFISSLQNPMISGASSVNEGRYYIIVTGSSSNCPKTDSIDIVVKPQPITTVSNSGPICAGSPLSLYASTAFAGVSFQWTGPNSFTSGAQNPFLASPFANASGTYTVTATLNGCTYTANTLATVHPIPVAVAGGNLPVCVGGAVQLNGNSLPNATYIWTGPLSYSSFQQSPSFAATSTLQSGNYILQVTSNGCVSEPDTVYIPINIMSRIGGYVSPNETICLGTSPTFISFVQDGGNAPVAQWYKNHQPVGAPNTFSLTDPNVSDGDIYYCKLTAPGVCSTTLTLYTDTFTMSVLPIVTIPIVTISANPGLHITPSQTVTFTANVQNGGTTPKYQWYKNGTIAAGATYATWTTNALSYGDLISVNIISQDPCTQVKIASDTVMIQFPASITDINKNKASLYPNPNNGSFMITGVGRNKIDVLLMNALGQIVHRQTEKDPNNSISLHTNLVPGHYTIKLISSTEQMIFPFTIHP